MILLGYVRFATLIQIESRLTRFEAVFLEIAFSKQHHSVCRKTLGRGSLEHLSVHLHYRLLRALLPRTKIEFLHDNEGLYMESLCLPKSVARIFTQAVIDDTTFPIV